MRRVVVVVGQQARVEVQQRSSASRSGDGSQRSNQVDGELRTVGLSLREPVSGTCHALCTQVLLRRPGQREWRRLSTRSPVCSPINTTEQAPHRAPSHFQRKIQEVLDSPGWTRTHNPPVGSPVWHGVRLWCRPGQPSVSGALRWAEIRSGRYQIRYQIRMSSANVSSKLFTRE